MFLKEILLVLLLLFTIFADRLNLLQKIPKNLKRKISGLKIVKNVVDGLIYRELKTRVTKSGSGIIGIFIEPIAVIVVFLLIFSLIRGSNPTLDTRLFLLSGILLFTLFTQIALRSINAITANEPLFIYRPVKPLDTIIARTLIETGLYGFVFLTLSFGIFYLAEEIILNDFPLMVISFLLLSLTSFGFGLLLMVLGHKYPSLKNFLPVITRPLWFVSGVFFSIRTLPDNIIPWISWNPILQAIELIRHSYSINYIIDKQIVSLNYLTTCAIVSCTFGLWIYLKNEKLLIKK